MTKKDPAILRAERLRVLIAMPEYAATLGAWIEEAHRSALHDMTGAKEPHEFHAAQGAYKAIDSLKEQFERVFIAEKAALERINKQSKTETNQ